MTNDVTRRSPYALSMFRFHTITSNTSAARAEGVLSPPLLEDEESTSFLDRLQNDSDEGKPYMINHLAALGRGVGSRFTTSPSYQSSAASPSAPSTSSPLSRHDSNLSFSYLESPAPDQLPSHRPFDMSCEMDSIPNIADEGSGLYDTSAANED